MKTARRSMGGVIAWIGLCASAGAQGLTATDATATRCAAAPPSAASASASASAPVSAVQRTMVGGHGACIEVLASGRGPLIVLLPSRGRGADDFDDAAARFVAAGFRVLRPQPRGIGASVGPMDDLTLHDLANDVAMVIREAGRGERAIVVGHAFGSWVARMTAVDFPGRVRGVVVAATVAKRYPAIQRAQVETVTNLALADDVRLPALQQAFFAPGHAAAAWLTGWYPATSESQDKAGKNTLQSQWWSGGLVPLLDLQAEFDPLRPAESRDEMRTEFGAERVTVAVVPQASHALFPEQPEAVVEAIGAWARRLP